ncbi:hypothetical protein F5Y14DRAFT_61354 [Nemania sp. NC0429]|nr:hypothetical protein F5Y14DRAFT_61354 [Nemania sp. NC0429]
MRSKSPFYHHYTTYWLCATRELGHTSIWRVSRVQEGGGGCGTVFLSPLIKKLESIARKKRAGIDSCFKETASQNFTDPPKRDRHRQAKRPFLAGGCRPWIALPIQLISHHADLYNSPPPKSCILSTEPLVFKDCAGNTHTHTHKSKCSQADSLAALGPRHRNGGVQPGIRNRLGATQFLPCVRGGGRPYNSQQLKHERRKPPRGRKKKSCETTHVAPPETRRAERPLNQSPDEPDGSSKKNQQHKVSIIDKPGLGKTRKRCNRARPTPSPPPRRRWE